jgi:hypothetical protein
MLGRELKMRHETKPADGAATVNRAAFSARARRQNWISTGGRKPPICE